VCGKVAGPYVDDVMKAGDLVACVCVRVCVCVCVVIRDVFVCVSVW